MKHRNLSKKINILTALFTISIVLSMIFFAASSGSGNADTAGPGPEDILWMRSIELGAELERLDNVGEAKVLVTASGDEISRVYVDIILTEKTVHPERNDVLQYVSNYFDGLDHESIELIYLDADYNPYP